VSETGEKTHPKRSATSVGAGRPRQPATSVTTSTSASTIAATVTRRNLYGRAVGPG
jgi:hypothetical protein